MIPRLMLFVLISALELNIIFCKVYRLPDNIKPARYFLTLEPHLKFSTLSDPIPYYGNVTMELKILKSTRNITFHGAFLKIDESSIKVLNELGKELKVATTSVNENENTYTVQTEDELISNETYILQISKFHNNLDDNPYGFFKAFYTVLNKETGENETRILAATHFEPNSASTAFPCFDEPAMKAKFIVSLIRREGFNSLSNQELESTEDLGNGRFKDTFKETPIMPTYTLAFVISDYTYKSLGKFRIFAKSSSVENNETDFALETSEKTLRFLEEYTGVPYVLGKIDQFAAPSDYFLHHAMENWGLIIYGDIHLLRSGTYDSASNYQRTTCYIAHELAHQWFGNLVTPAWWNYLWIGESFASYFQYHAASAVQPSWKLKEQFVIDMVHQAFRKEERESAQPLNYPVAYTGDMPPSHIAYEKGSVIVRMMEHFLTQEIFKKGLNIYLNKNKFKAAIPSNLYNALQEAVDIADANHLLNNMKVSKIMETWDSNKGFPIITVTRNYKTGRVTITQKSGFDEHAKWIVPINFVPSSDKTMDFSKTTSDFWLTEESVVINRNLSSDGWFLVNKQQTGYYRVNYDLKNWKRIIEFMTTGQFELIHVSNRVQLLEDAFNLASRQELPWDIPLQLGEYIKQERDYIALAAFCNALDSYVLRYEKIHYQHQKAKESIVFQNYTLINSIDPDATEFDLQKSYISSVLSGILDELGTSSRENDTHLDRLSRTKLMNYYGVYLK